MKRIGIIIVNYKDYAERFLKDFIISLRGQSSPDFLLKIYIIDNCSSRESKSYLKKTVPEAKVIPRSDGNYAAANCLGIDQAKEDGCDYFVVVNMDVKFKKDWLKELVKVAESGERIGIVQSKILLFPKSPEEEKQPKINSLGNVLNFLGFGFTQGYGCIDVNKDIKEIKGYASGCSMLIKKEVIEKIGNYDSQYYMYHDDLELCWRAKLAGYKIVLAPLSVVYHKYEFKRSIKMFYYMERNRYIAIFSFYKLPTLLLIFPALLVMDTGMFIFSIINGWFLTELKIAWYFYKLSSWQHIFKVRKKVKRFRVVKDKDIIKNMSGKIEFQEVMNPLLKYVANSFFEFYLKIIKKIIWW